MFTANGERVALHHNDSHLTHQQDGGKELLGFLTAPFLSDQVHYDTLREVLDAVTSGNLTVEAAKAEIERIERYCGVGIIARPVEVTAEGLQAGCDRLQAACDRLESSLARFSRAVDESCKKLDDLLRERT